MKRYFAMLLAVVLLCICTGAVAMGWGRTDNPPPTYTVTVTKLDKVATTSGVAYTPAPGKAAMVDIEKVKKDLSDVQTIKNILGLEEND